MSQSNLVCVDGNMLLSFEEIKMVLVILRMNREFMRHIRQQHHNHLSKQEFRMTAVRIPHSLKVASFFAGDGRNVKCENRLSDREERRVQSMLQGNRDQKQKFPRVSAW